MLTTDLEKLINSFPKRYTQLIKKNHNVFYKNIKETFYGNTFAEKLYRYMYKINPSCSNCESKNVKFLDFKRGFAKFCSRKCVAIGTMEQKKQTNLKKYGVDHYSKTASYSKKFKETCLNRYGVDNPGKSIDVIERKSKKKQKTFFQNLINDISEYTKPLITFDDYVGVREIINWQCVLCDHKFKSHVFNKKPKCPKCFPTAQYGGQSQLEVEIINFIKSIYDGPIDENRRDIIKPKELDIFLPAKNIAIEVCGLYWHSSKFIDPAYHLNKLRLCEKQGIKLITLFDYQWYEKNEIIKARLKSLLGVDTVIYARKCILSKISYKESKVFLKKHHLFGYAIDRIRYGLFYNNELVSVMTFGKSRFTKNKDKYEMIRYASKMTIVGGASKLLSQFEKDNNVDLISYADRTWSSSLENIYITLGFVFEAETKPNFKYWNKDTKILENRLIHTKQKLVKQGYDPKQTGEEIMKSLGFYKIYDCGSLKYKKEKN